MTKFGFVLDEFAINSAELTETHKKRLDELVADIRRPMLLTKKDWWLIHLTGSASQSGDDAYNEELSRRRAQSVEDYLERRFSGIVPAIPRKFRKVALGETAPENRKLIENARDRAVGVTAILTGGLPPPPPPPPPPPSRIDPGVLLKPRIAPRKEFTLTVESFVTQSVGAGPVFTEVRIGRIMMNFTIDDGVKQGAYTFYGEGLGAGFSLVPKVSPGEVRSKARGTPQKFTAYEGITSADFAGEGQMSLLGSFHFGGIRRPPGSTRRYDDYAMGVIHKFDFPPSVSTLGPPLPGKDEFRGEVTKGFKPRISHWPMPLGPLF